MSDNTSKSFQKWKPVLGYEGIYAVSVFGEVKSLRKLKILSPGKTKRGYLTVSLSSKGNSKTYYVHRLVLESFVGPCPVGLEARHLNGDKEANNLFNLQWGTSDQNVEDNRRLKVYGKNRKHFGKSVSKIVALRIAGFSYSHIEEVTGIPKATAHRLYKGLNHGG